MGFGTVFVVHCSFGSSLFLYYHGDYLLKKKIFLVVNSVKSDRWKSSANDVAFELFELAACGHIWTNTSRYFDKLYKRIIQTPSHNTVHKIWHF